jgi:hypothetical protein
MYTSEELCAGAAVPFLNHLTGFPSPIEASRHPQKLTLESPNPSFHDRQISGFPRPLLGKDNSFFDVRSWNVYENKQNMHKSKAQIEGFRVETGGTALTISVTWEQSGRIVGFLAPSLVRDQSVRSRQIGSRAPLAELGRRPRKMVSEATICMKTVNLFRIRGFAVKSYIDDNKRFRTSVEVGEQKSRGKKYSGRSHDVIENKGKCK